MNRNKMDKHREQINLIYLLGAGRSGTTLLSTLLNAQEDITTLGEMHQFYDYLYNDWECACGKLLADCEFWGEIITALSLHSNQVMECKLLYNRMEKHSRIPFYLLGLGNNPAYDLDNETVFSEVKNNIPSKWLLDSSKYIGRYLLLRKNSSITIKGIYVVRDVRGVIHSFQKNVQTSRNPFSALVYYSLINFFGQLVCWMDPKVIKIRYEDLMQDPKKTQSRIYSHIFEKDMIEVSIHEFYDMPHIIGGNRMKQLKVIKINKDDAWKRKQSRFNKSLYYIMSLPLMLLNRYDL
ncbi:MAG: sulfotransferase [Flavobacteriaceae bacterium]|nr:sulfotransferase [Flavobacteriaceae bacterium]MDH3795387.1 sulfotransferase [Flavobacteriaceae bacterium]